MDDSPADWMSGHDVQPEAAIRYILDELAKKPESLPDPLPRCEHIRRYRGATEETRTRCGKCRTNDLVERRSALAWA